MCGKHKALVTAQKKKELQLILKREKYFEMKIAGM